MELRKLRDFERIYYADTLFDEYAALFGKNSVEYTRHLKKLYENLSILDNNGVIQLPRFEKLKGGNGLFAIRHVTKINPRVIFAIETSEGAIILLAAFKEGSSSDYDAAIHRATTILKGLEG